MRPNQLIYFALSVLILGCSPQKQESEVTSKEPIQKEQVLNLKDCTMSALYNLEGIEIEKYDSLDTRYFHQIVDYKDNPALKLQGEIARCKMEIAEDTLGLMSDEIRDSILQKVKEHEHNISHYEKKIVGYVFVHTFLNDADTVSCIVYMNDDCSKQEAIRVKTISDINPDDYTLKIRRIDN